MDLDLRPATPQDGPDWQKILIRVPKTLHRAAMRYVAERCAARGSVRAYSLNELVIEALVERLEGRP